MAVLDARPASQSLDATDPDIVEFADWGASNSTVYAWVTTGGDIVLVRGTAITTEITAGVFGRPTGGTAKEVSLDLGNDGQVDATVRGISVPLTSLVDDAASFWATLLKGGDTIHAPASSGATLFGDLLALLGGSTATGGQDSISGGSGQAQALYGDAFKVGANEALGEIEGTGILRAGRDTIVARNTEGTSLIVGDAGSVNSSSELYGNADILTGSDTRPDTIIGDVDLLFDAFARGANDTISGRGGDDTLIGDIRAIQRFPGAASGPSGSGGHDQINGGAGDDTIYGDFVTVSNADVGAISFASGGNDTINGYTGNDTIYGDSPEINGAYIRLGRDTIYGGDGNDNIFGDGAHIVTSFFLPDSRVNGSDTLHGGGGDDTLDGGLDNDQLFGESGSDTLDGGFGGNDEMTGGIGSDIFRFLTASRLDRILDFKDDIDTIEISSAYGFADAAAVVATAVAGGGDIVLHLTAEDTIRLVGYGAGPNSLLNDIEII